MPYGLVADIHAHAWSAFSTKNEAGVNSRLIGIMDELDRAVAELKRQKGRHLVIAGDLFHARGSIDPEVFNYVYERIKAIREVAIYALPGNHDLKDKETTALGNAFHALAEIPHFHIAETPMVLHTDLTSAVVVPWHSTKEGLFAAIEKVIEELSGNQAVYDLILHAGINGVLMGMPDHGIDYTELEAFGFNRVFAGHYHNHKPFPGGKVYSIGATTHQKWSDIGTRAGFLMVHPSSVDYHASHQPLFIEIDGETPHEDIPLLVDGHYVRITSMKLTDADIATMRAELLDMGAKGVVFQVARETVSARTGAAMKTKSLAEAVGDYVTELKLPATSTVPTRVANILDRAQEKAA